MKISNSATSYISVCADWVCRILFLLCIGGALQRRYLTDSDDPDKCKTLLNDGKWLDQRVPGADPDSAYQHWQPRGCMMHKYTRTDIEQCLGEGGQKVVIAGDSTGRQIFRAFVEKAGYTWDDIMHRHVTITAMHHHMEFHIGDVQVKFIWSPLWNGTILADELEGFRWNATAGHETDSPALIFMRAPGLWLARDDLSRFQNAMNDALEHLEPRPAGDLRTSVNSNLFLISPVQIPAYDVLPQGSKTRPVDLPQRHAAQNDYVQNVTTTQNLPLVWSHARMLTGDDSVGKHVKDGVHLTYNVRNAEADVVLNLRCNRKHAASQGFPHDRTCCMAYKNPGMIQSAIFAVGLILLLLLCWRGYRALSNSVVAKALENTKAALTLVLVLCFCFLADRTHVFEKVHKQFFLLDFGILCATFFIAGLVSVRAIPSTKIGQELFLSREQTDEWKGWMQVLILIYHYTGASPVVEIYKIIRLTVSAYLFLTGYGNTLSLLGRPDFTLRKVTSSVIRLNILSIGLSYMMSTNYLFYYFPALATFWYLIVYTTLAVGHSKNDDIQFLSCKIIISIFSTTGFILIPGVMEAMSSVFQIVFRVDWDIPEWRFRMTLDLFIVYIGMFMALIRHNQQQQANHDAIGSHGRFLKLKEQVIKHGSKVSIVVMLLLLAGYILISRTLADKYTYNHMHPFISWMPILAFIIIRNLHPLRSYYSAMFAWIGQISLETYVLQYHIWLAADTKGLLQLGLFNRWVEAAILTPVYIWISWYTSDATRIVVKQMTSVARSEVRANEEQQADGYSLLPLTAEESGNAEDSKAADPLLVDVPDVPERPRIPLNTSWKAMLGPVHSLLGIYRKVVGDLRWRLVIFVLVLWISNLVADAEIRGVMGLSWMFGETEE